MYVCTLYIEIISLYHKIIIRIALEFVYVIGRMGVVFGINSASIVNRKE